MLAKKLIPFIQISDEHVSHYIKMVVSLCKEQPSLGLTIHSLLFLFSWHVPVT